MLKTFILLLSAAIPLLAEDVPSSFKLLEKHAVATPDHRSDSLESRVAYKKDSYPETEHPVYRGENQNQGRARIEPVRPAGPIIKNDPMLADQPNISSEVNRIDELTIPGYAYVPAPPELAYPDIPYAPGYGYDNGYASSNSYDIYGVGPNNYLIENDPSTFGLLWNQVPYGRTLVSYVGRTIHWLFSSIFVLLLGSLITVGVCSYTNLCTIDFHGVGPIHEEVRSLMSPDRLEKISTAADFVKNAIGKYQEIQKVNEQPNRQRRSVFKQ